MYKQAAYFFKRHWILYYLNFLMWKAKKTDMSELAQSTKHLKRMISFHENYYPRPTMILAVMYEELGCALRTRFPRRKSLHIKHSRNARNMLNLLRGENSSHTLRSCTIMLHPFKVDENRCISNTPGMLATCSICFGVKTVRTH
eukprot:gnl/TRDRNA2_/TRDRNA2_150455_c0_seq1.p1 gnl/TRDRNA2_/TRDRNA2_150455_c0~~gnl/TRDRNA2_/TRDRNA2_150455_c0_seq1.p1  ORF type:complete len:144 (+),score=7.71 gnl/TRDRNA2_/TRDRNA2_150455_c0_seq1:2-433(+)